MFNVQNERYTSQTDKPPILSRETGSMRFKVEHESVKII